MTETRSPEHEGYCAGHPWYYLLGGTPPSLEQIAGEARRRGYQGWMRDIIAKADRLEEPKRSAELRRLMEQAEAEKVRDLESYRKYAAELEARRASHTPVRRCGRGWRPDCTELDVSMSLKHNHLFNDLAHIRLLTELLQRQPSLF